jgi:hypothetical protein
VPVTAPGIAYIRTHAKPPSYSARRLCFQAFRLRAMTDEQLAAMHRLLAEYHRKLAKEAVPDVVQQYHADLAQRFADGRLSIRSTYVRIIATQNSPIILAASNIVDLKPLEDPRDLHRGPSAWNIGGPGRIFMNGPRSVG